MPWLLQSNGSVLPVTPKLNSDLSRHSPHSFSSCRKMRAAIVVTALIAALAFATLASAKIRVHIVCHTHVSKYSAVYHLTGDLRTTLVGSRRSISTLSQRFSVLRSDCRVFSDTTTAPTTRSNTRACSTCWTASWRASR